jgi:hypothetical protein
VPGNAALGRTFARFRISSQGGLTPVGLAWEGEVEDYLVTIAAAIDFGDAPDPTYPTLLASDGARHYIVPGMCLGRLIDAEPDGQPDPWATGDDNANFADEDGVTFLTSPTPGNPSTIVPPSISISLNFLITMSTIQFPPHLITICLFIDCET